jgi:hypothetical protein
LTDPTIEGPTGYDAPPYFQPPLPGINELVGHHLPHHINDGRLPPLSFPPISPFPYDNGAVDMFGHDAGMHNPDYHNPAQMPLLPFINNDPEFGSEHRAPPSASQEMSPPPPKKSRTGLSQRNSKPLCVEDLLHDHSRFAKVVKAFLSIDAPEERTVPEISKRVGELYAGQYPDFEAVKVSANLLS